MNIVRGFRDVFMRAGFGAALITVLAATVLALPANAVTFYEDTETGQLFTKPGPGRVQIEGEVIIVKPDASGASDRAAASDKKDWTDNFDVWADLRLRYEFRGQEYADNSKTRHRARYRFRLGTEATVNEQVKLGAELRSGSGDPRSDNTTFSGNSGKFDIRIAKAYAAWTPMDWLSVTGGQFGNPLYKPKDLVWDGDINPQGAAFNVEADLGPAKTFLTSGLFILDQITNDDPLLVPVQAGAGVKIGDVAKAKAAATYYIYSNLKGRAPGVAGNGTNSAMGGNLVYDYDAIGASGEVSFKIPGPVPTLKVFGDYVYNFDPSRDNTGWMAGVKVGSSKISGLGDWQLAYNYRRLESDAIPDFLPDSDSMGGNTGITAHEVEAKLGLGKHVEFGLDGYHARDITSNRDEYLFQADLIFKAK